MIVHQVGRGQTLLLNFTGNYSPSSYDDVDFEPVRTVPAGDTYRDLALLLARLGGIEPEVEAVAEEGRLRGIDIITYHDGDAAYYGFTPNDWYEFSWLLTMPLATEFEGVSSASGHFYDAREGKYLGKGRSFQATLERGSAVVVARLPYRVSGLDIAGPAAVKTGEEAEFRIRVRAGNGEPGRHVVHCDLAGPDGGLLRHYAANLVATNGEAVFTLPLALSDADGTWVLSCRDIATGTSASRSFEVSSGR